jgi:glutamyl-tRNA synthetase
MVRTRFAPSPTGFLHIGGVRTALFNWLFSRRHGGQFILRIDDTDQQRNVEESLKPILDGFRWLGIDWDEGPEVDGPHAPYFQSQRGQRYGDAAKALLNAGAAYWDYARPDEIQAQRDAAEREKRQFVYDRRWKADTAAQRERFEQEGRTGVVRLKMPREGELVLDDLVRGRVQFPWASEQDHVIQRADGSCLYHLATVVDDHDFEISHVIRAEEHLSNTPRQVFIAQSLHYDIPQFAHLPYVAEPGSKNKLSKRKLDNYLKNRDFAKINQHGQQIAAAIGLETTADTFNPVIVDFYRIVGYLPDAIVNYLLLLGWSLDDKSETFSREEMIGSFSLQRVNKAPASFDPQKLSAFQERYMRELPKKRMVAFVLPYLQQAGLVSSPPPCDIGPKLTQIVDAAGGRIVVAGDILEYADFFVADDELAYDEKAFDKRIRRPENAAGLLARFSERLSDVNDFQPPALEEALKEFVAAEQINIGDIIHALRVAVTGKAVGFGMFETLSILGKAHCVARIDVALNRLT